MINWEGAELCYYINGESHALSLSVTLFAVVAKILGLELQPNGIACYSDDTLKKLLKMQGNPLRLKEM